MNESGADPGRLRRRLVSIPAHLVLGLVSLALLPAALPVTVLLDMATDRRMPRTRCVLFFCFYFNWVDIGVVALGLAWLGCRIAPSANRSLRWNRWIQYHWIGKVLDGANVIFGLEYEVSAPENLEPGPILVFARHASFADTTLPMALVTRPHGRPLRYVIKRELLWVPCFDLCGQRIPNVFVRRQSSDGTAEIEEVRELGRTTPSGEGVLIYPEGTRATPAKRARVLARMEASADPERLAAARRLRHLLPPRLGGTLALMESMPAADIVIIEHTGFEGLATFADIWSGRIVGRTIQIRVRRIPRSGVPEDNKERIRWLLRTWQEVDDWIESVATSATADRSDDPVPT